MYLLCVLHHVISRGSFSLFNPYDFKFFLYIRTSKIMFNGSGDNWWKAFINLSLNVILVVIRLRNFSSFPVYQVFIRISIEHIQMLL